MKTRRVTLKRENLEEGKTEWLPERQVPCKLYDQKKTRRQDKDYKEPYRYITNWFLTSKPEHFYDERMPLPETSSMSHLCLFGEIKPNRQDHPSNYKVQITDLKVWYFDRDDDGRGMWVLSRQAWYKLLQPCTKVITQNDGIRTSQDILHQPVRANCGLLNNILDMLSDSNGNLEDQFVSFFSELTPEECYDVLEKPFDFDLLKRDPAFVKDCLSNLHENLPDSCVFVNGLKKLRLEYSQARKRKMHWVLRSFDYCASAEMAEERSNRHPWGCRKLNSNGTRKNKLAELISLQMENKGQVAKRLKTTTKAEEEQDKVTKKPQRYVNEDQRSTSKISPKKSTLKLKKKEEKNEETFSAKSSEPNVSRFQHYNNAFQHTSTALEEYETTDEDYTFALGVNKVKRETEESFERLITNTLKDIAATKAESMFLKKQTLYFDLQLRAEKEQDTRVRAILQQQLHEAKEIYENVKKDRKC